MEGDDKLGKDNQNRQNCQCDKFVEEREREREVTTRIKEKNKITSQ